MSKIENTDDRTNLRSLRGKVFTQLENDILNGKYQPGESLIETRLSEELGVSRTPIREAIRQLELEGLVQSTPNKGAVVTGISGKDIEDIYTIRTMIEGLAARWAAEKLTTEEIEELKEAVELEEFYTNKNDTNHMLLLDSKFHEIIFKASKSKLLMQILSMLHHYIQRARVASLQSPDRAKRALEEHKAILSAIIERDAQKAESLTTKHIRNASVNFIKKVNKAGE